MGFKRSFKKNKKTFFSYFLLKNTFSDIITPYMLNNYERIIKQFVSFVNTFETKYFNLRIIHV